METAGSRNTAGNYAYHNYYVYFENGYSDEHGI